MAKKKPYRFFLYILFRALAGVIVLLPRKTVLNLARLFGRLAFYLVPRQRRKAVENLSFAYAGAKAPEEINALARGVFENFALTAVDVLRARKLDQRKTLEIVEVGDAFKVYDSILAEGKGLISVTAHLGNWEFLAGVFGLNGYSGAVLARRIYYEPYNRWIVGLRAAMKVPTIYRDESSREILKRLGRGEIIGLLPDQDIDSLKGVFIPFFGKPAYTPVAPARLSLASGAPILPNFMVRTAYDRYRIVLGEIIRPRTDLPRDEAMRLMTEDWMRQFEKVIRAYPDQWGWVHDRWKTQPDSAEVTERV